MRKNYELSVEVPQGIECFVEEKVIRMKKDGNEVQRIIDEPGVKIELADGEIKISREKSNKKNIAVIAALAAHLRNMIKGATGKFVYKLEICHVHFPMVVKVEGNKVVISNFLGEKKNRSAEIIDGVKVEVKGNEIIVSGNDIEKAGQTAANIEKATRVSKRDRRVFQDGCFITEKPKGAI